MCKQIDHFPEDADYKAEASEYFLRESFFHQLLYSLVYLIGVFDSFLFLIINTVCLLYLPLPFKLGGQGRRERNYV